MSGTITAPTSPADATAAINGALGSGMGRYILPAGSYNVDTIVIPNGVELIGEGQFTTTVYGRVVFPANQFPGRLENLCVAAPNSMQINAVQVEHGCVGVIIRDVRALGGYSALYIAGTDCHISNCYFGDSGGTAAVVSNGANWYERCKIDSQSNPGWYAGFLQGEYSGDGVAENHFTDCDFSGPYTFSIYIDDAHSQAITVFNGAVMSAPCFVGHAKWTAFLGCELTARIENAGGAPCTVANCWAASAMKVIGSNLYKSNNVNIT